MDFHELYERYSQEVYRFALFLSGDAATADDLTSETFVRAWAGSGQIRQATVKAYLFTIVRNLHRDLIRRQKPRGELDESLPDPAANPERAAGKRLELARVLGGLRRLTPLDRTLLLLRIHEEMPYEEIGEAVGLDAAAVRMRIHRARAKLAEVR